MKSIRELNNYCLVMNKRILVKNGKLKGFLKED
jgi:hypothetical protein